MTKTDLIERVSMKTTILTKKQTEIVVNMLFDSIKEALAAGDKIEIRGFGSFRIRARQNREGRNPKTGQSVVVPQKKVPFFKAGKELKELVDGHGGLIFPETV
ncbi:MAG: integration host factor subunit beta [Nitrospirae bacterium]|nr:integration host factor subunit beta [Nitrospirota bacterium]